MTLVRYCNGCGAAIDDFHRDAWILTARLPLDSAGEKAEDICAVCAAPVRELIASYQPEENK